MGRQRMVSDGFWDDPDLADLTHEQRCTLLLFLTCKQSNVIGVYRIIWRQVGAGAGWTQDQTINAARSLQSNGCIEIDESTGWVWVKEWWKHNSLRGAFTGNVAKKALQELSQVPEFWKQAVLGWIADNDNEGACKSLISPLQGAGGNHTTSPSSNPNTTTPQLVVEIDDFIEAAVWATPAITSESGFRRTVRDRIQSEGPNSEDRRSLDAWRAWRARQDAEREGKERDAQKLELERSQREELQVRYAKAEVFFGGLNEVSRAALLRKFGDHLADIQSPVLPTFKRSGISAKMVQFEFYKFILSTTPSFAFNETEEVMG